MTIKLTPQEHEQLRHVCEVDQVTAAAVVRAGMLVELRRRIRYKGMGAERLRSIAVYRSRSFAKSGTEQG